MIHKSSQHDYTKQYRYSTSAIFWKWWTYCLGDCRFRLLWSEFHATTKLQTVCRFILLKRFASLQSWYLVRKCYKHTAQTVPGWYTCLINSCLATTSSHPSPAINKAVEVIEPSEVLKIGGAGNKVTLPFTFNCLSFPFTWIFSITGIISTTKRWCALVQVLQILDGVADAYVFPSKGTKKWDTCAPEACLMYVVLLVAHFCTKMNIYSCFCLAHTERLEAYWRTVTVKYIVTVQTHN